MAWDNLYNDITILIESKWNLNEHRSTLGCNISININRIKVEFKSLPGGFTFRLVYILIESKWNLNEETDERGVEVQ